MQHTTRLTRRIRNDGSVIETVSFNKLARKIRFNSHSVNDSCRIVSRLRNIKNDYNKNVK